MNFRYDLIEEDIIRRLRPVFDNRIDIVQTPQSEKEFEKPLLNGRITIIYSQSGYNEVTSTNQIRQLETLQFEVHIQAKLLRGDNGLHDMNERARRRLAGWMPENCSKIWLRSNSFIERDAQNNVFTYMMTIATTYLFVEDTEDEGGPELNNVQFNISET